MSREQVRDKYITRALPIMQRLEEAGFEAYLVGGCVREALREEVQVKLEEKFREELQEDLPGAKVGKGASTDLDIATDALPEEVSRVFRDCQLVETGLKHGTLKVLLEAGEEPAQRKPGTDGREVESAQRPIPVEITTYRVDGAYSDGRHPDQVRFVPSLREDLARRDFTINAMAMDLRGHLADPFGGQEDLAAGRIRAVGDPDIRFGEDALRILRGLRFAAVLEKPATGGQELPREAFRIEAATEAALFRSAPLLKGISAERIFSEIKKLLKGPAAATVVRRYAAVLAEVIPELGKMQGFSQNNPYHKYDVLEHCIRAMESIDAVPEVQPAEGLPAKEMPGSDEKKAGGQAPAGRRAPADLVTMRLAALLHDVGKPVTYTEDENGIGHFYGHPRAGAKIARQILHRLKADRASIERITHLIHYHDLVFQEDEALLKRWMNRHGPQVLLEILAIKRADNIATGNVSQELLDKFDRIEGQIRSICQQAMKGESCFQMRDLAISGKDLLAAGVPEGPLIGRTLRELLDKVMDGELPNEKAALLAAVDQRLREVL